MRALIVVLVVAVAGAAQADPPGETPPASPAPANPAPANPAPNPPSPPAPAPPIAPSAAPPAIAPSIPPIPPPPSPELDALARGDAAATRGFAFDSGLVLRTGHVELSLRTVFERGSDLSVAVGVGGGVQLSIDGIYGNDGGYKALGGMVRMQLAHGRQFAMSIAAGYHFASSSLFDPPFDGDYLTLGVDAALAATQRLLLSWGLGVVRYEGNDGGSGSTDFFGHADVVYGRSWVRLLGELAYLGSPYGLVGVRFATRYASVDLGFVPAFIEKAESSPVVVLGLTGRL